MLSKMSSILAITASLTSLSHIYASEMDVEKKRSYHISLHLQKEKEQLLSLYQEHTLKGTTFSLDLNHTNDYSFEEIKRDMQNLWGEQPLRFPVSALKLNFFLKEPFLIL